MITIWFFFDNPLVMLVLMGPNITGSQIELKHTYKTKRCNLLTTVIKAYLLKLIPRRIRSHDYIATKIYENTLIIAKTRVAR